MFWQDTGHAGHFRLDSVLAFGRAPSCLHDVDSITLPILHFSVSSHSAITFTFKAELIILCHDENLSAKFKKNNTLSTVIT